MAHIYHPDLGDPAREGILVDGCYDCEAAAARPLRLDAIFTKALWQKMVAVEHTGKASHYASHAEAIGCRRLYEIATFIARYLPQIDPWEMFA